MLPDPWLYEAIGVTYTAPQIAARIWAGRRRPHSNLAEQDRCGSAPVSRPARY
jgi:hypothetical protein